MDGNSLSSQQQNARNIITTRHRRVEVSASPGSGKTRSLIERLKHLMVERGISGEEIAVLSFSNATVNELKRRLEKEQEKSKIDFSGVTLNTVHAYALSLSSQPKVKLKKSREHPRKKGERLKGLKSHVQRGKSISDKEQIKLLKQATQKAALKRSMRKRWPSLSVSQREEHGARLLTLCSDIGLLKLLGAAFSFKSATSEKFAIIANRSQFHALKPFVKVFPAVRAAYNRLKERRSLIDYDDMLSSARQLVAESPDSVKHRHFLVDEFQDSSPTQIALIASLTQFEGRTVMAFGDPLQSIYGFMGASYTPLREQLSDVKTLSMPCSRRLTKEVAALASAVIGAKGAQRIETLKQGEVPRLLEFESTEVQAKALVAEIRRLIESGIPASHIAILARTKAQLTEIEAALLVTTVNTMRLNDTRRLADIRNVLKLVRIIDRQSDKDTKIDVESVKSALPKAIRAEVSVHAVKKLCASLKRAKKMPSFGGRYIECAKAYMRLHGGVRANKHLQHDLNRWQPIALKYQKSSEMQRALRIMTDDNAVVTGTIHAAKGQEWSRVYVIGVTDGVLPIHFAIDDDAMTQEQKSMYVAVTRAIDTLTLCHAPITAPGTRERFETRSRFISSHAVLRYLNVEADG